MGLFDRIRESLTGQRVCPLEHLESYRRLGEQVYELHVELAGCSRPRALAFMQAARSLQMMADGLLNDAFSSFGDKPKAVPIITHEQADVWYGWIPDLIIAARQEAAYPDSSKQALPLRLGEQMEGPQPCPIEHLSGLRQSVERMDEFTKEKVDAVRTQGEAFKEVILLYESARTRKQAGDAIVGALTGGRKVSAETHEDAEKQYWMALSDYFLIAQGVEFPESLKRIPAQMAALSRTCKLDSNDVWRVTSARAKQDIRRSGEWQQAIADLREHWEGCRVTEVEREYETTVEQLLEKGLIEENGYWYCCPFPSVYQVTPRSASVEVLGRTVPKGHVFVYEYGDDGAPGRFVTAASFQTGVDRKYCDD